MTQEEASTLAARAGKNPARLGWLGLAPLLWGASACGKEAPPASVPEPAPSATVTPSPAPPVMPAPPAVESFRFVEEQATDFSAHTYLRSPLPRRLTRAELQKLEVNPGVPHGSAASTFVALDDHAPRWATRPLPLVRLVNEDVELTPGVHRLVLFGKDRLTISFEVAYFWLEAEPAGDPAPGCLLVDPAGTYNGDAQADRITLRALPLTPRVETVEYTWSGPGSSGRVQKDVRVPLRVLEVPSGDFHVVARCLGPGGVEIERVERTITVNRDAPVPAEPL